MRNAVESALEGKPEAVELGLICMLARGHLLIEDVPGVGKTTLARSLAQVVGGDLQRIQFTSDLLPSDVLGVSIYDQKRGEFEFKKGPIFTPMLLADEINRASPRTQSALLQAMQEHRVSVAGRYHALPTPFHVLATQNPLELEGTYPLPEAQLDRFFMQVDVDYPDADAERDILLKTTGVTEEDPPEVMNADALLSAQKLIRQVPVGESVIKAILDLVRGGRAESSSIEEVRKSVFWGPGPRASQALMLAVRARSVIDGRLAPSVDDVLALAHPVLRHRMALNFAARAEGVTIGGIIDRLCEGVA